MNSKDNLDKLAKDALVDSVKAGIDESKDVLVAQLKKKSFFNALVKGLNKSIDIPFIGEDTEEKVLKAVLKVCIDALEEVDFNDED
jgi:hypothetical protein